MEKTLQVGGMSPPVPEILKGENLSIVHTINVDDGGTLEKWLVYVVGRYTYGDGTTLREALDTAAHNLIKPVPQYA